MHGTINSYGKVDHYTGKKNRKNRDRFILDLTKEKGLTDGTNGEYPKNRESLTDELFLNVGSSTEILSKHRSHTKRRVADSIENPKKTIGNDIRDGNFSMVPFGGLTPVPMKPNLMLTEPKN